MSLDHFPLWVMLGQECNSHIFMSLCHVLWTFQLWLGRCLSIASNCYEYATLEEIIMNMQLVKPVSKPLAHEY